MTDRTLRVMERLSKDQNIFAKFHRIQRSVAALPVLAAYFIIGSYFTQFNFFHLKFILGGFALYLLSVAVNGYNNLFDIEEDKLAISSGIVKANYLLKEFTWGQLKWNFALTSITLAFVLVMIGNLEFIALCAFTYALGIIYTKPIRLKNRPLIGTLSNTYGFSIAPVLSGYFLLNGTPIPAIAFILSLFLPTFSSCLIAEIADREIDRKIGTRTTANWLGIHVKTVIKAVLIFSVVLYGIALVIHWAVILIAPFVAAILYETLKLYMDFTDKKADYTLVKIGANISRGFIIYVIAAIILHETAANLLTNFFTP
jgi:4-hydroxybenzoate polyprenyltransferase